MRKLIWLLAHLTGGRPMRLYEDQSFAFTDKVNGRKVNVYEDQFRRTYLAHSPWSWFREGINPTVD